MVLYSYWIYCCRCWIYNIQSFGKLGILSYAYQQVPAENYDIERDGSSQIEILQEMLTCQGQMHINVAKGL